MKFTTISRRLAATGAATALVSGALMGAPATSADAATATGSYDCSVPGVGPLGTLPMTLDAPGLEEFPSVPAGFVVPAGFLSANSVLGVPSSAAALLAGAGVVGGTVDDFGISIGDSVASAPLSVTSIVPASGGALDVSASGLNESFAMPAAGTYDILLPEAFTFMPATAAGPLGIPVECVTDAPASLGQIETPLNDSTTDARAKKRIRKGKRATVNAIVTGGFSTATGDVVAMKGTRTVGQGVLAEDGTTRFKLDRLKVGKHTIVVKYLGDGFRKASKDTLTIKVVKPRS